MCDVSLENTNNTKLNRRSRAAGDEGLKVRYVRRIMGRMGLDGKLDLEYLFSRRTALSRDMNREDISRSTREM